jgi:hypothetical protein
MQWRRVERSFAKLGGTYNDTEIYDDDVYHFFMDAWHLKDWIKNDPSVTFPDRNQIENDVGDVKALRIAADFANGAKHMIRTRSRSENAQFAKRRVSVTLGDPKARGTQERILNLSDGTSISAETLAGEVMTAWRLLLTKWQLSA